MKTRALKTPDSLLRTARTVSEALPYMREFAGETFVVKYGGHAMGDSELANQFARDIVLMQHVGIRPIVVHGGGPQIGKMLERLAIKSDFIDGLRVTDTATVEIVEMVLCGSINKQIAASINAAGGKAVGISGKDGNLMMARKIQRTKKDPDSNIERVLDLGYVGEPMHINPAILDEFASAGIIPVIAPIGLGEDGQTYNINADTAAGAIAGALGARKLMLLTDVAGILNKDKELISELNTSEARDLIEDGTVSGGMIPKVETCIYALERDTQSVHILDGRIPHVLLVETFTEHGAGTMMTQG
jgi:acetylglutamate kinase